MMKLEEQVVSLELAKRLKELGAAQEALFYWVRTIVHSGWTLVISESLDIREPDTSENVYEESGHGGEYWIILEEYAALTVAELGELLPRCYMSWATPQTGEMKWWCRRNERHFVTHEEAPIFTSSTEADARAKMLIWLLEQEKKE